jgi:Domain of unknown function (DUF4331)
MIQIIKRFFVLGILATAGLTSCDKTDSMTPTPTPTATLPDFSGSFATKDQMARPAINTVFVPAAMKDVFNTTVPSKMGGVFNSTFIAGLKGLSPAYAKAGDKNALGLDAATFASVLSTDVLSVATNKPTTFYDGTNVLTGRRLADDVITVELLLIFGGEDFKENPSLSDDHVDANDKPFSNTFPYLATAW